jgi:hypothetical protein
MPRPAINEYREGRAERDEKNGQQHGDNIRTIEAARRYGGDTSAAWRWRVARQYSFFAV